MCSFPLVTTGVRCTDGMLTKPALVGACKSSIPGYAASDGCSLSLAAWSNAAFNLCLATLFLTSCVSLVLAALVPGPLVLEVLGCRAAAYYIASDSTRS